MATKENWPELVGLKGEDARDQVKQQRPDVEIQILPELGPVTMDFRPDRVRIFVDKDGKVVHAPNCG